MSSKQKTFNDITKDHGGTAPKQNSNIRRRQASIVTEPMGNGIRVTARDDSDRLMWGFVAGPLTLESSHVLVATYEALRKEVADRIPDYNGTTNDATSQTQQCIEAIQSINTMLSKLKDRLSPKHVSDKTEKRAMECLPALRDIVTLLTYEITDKPGLVQDDSQ